MNDKRTLCILLVEGLLSVIDSLRSKIFTFEDIDRLEEMLSFCTGISHVVHSTLSNTCLVDVQQYVSTQCVFRPLIRQARQFEIHSLLCYIASLIRKVKKEKYFHTCKNVAVMNSFLMKIRPSRLFLEKFLVANPHFHSEVPKPPKQQRRWHPRYY